MNEIMIISALLSSINQAANLAKIFKESTTSLEKAEVNFKVAELIDALAEAKMSFVDVRNLLIEKDDVIKDLRKQLKRKEKMVYEKPFYFMIDENKKDGPYCQQCHDNESKLNRLTEVNSGYWQCMSCKSFYEEAHRIHISHSRTVNFPDSCNGELFR